ncbi:restriction endonuclease [Acetobacterium fimetarium]|uniref:Restriction endonuclease n=1 Tax=Acetobacterium fimetarium TaxID=52691 RepID=A0ABR6WZF2_9FIRM|nr:restriction endonuclease subunit S [Acetobacterium fimetarium]MBC3805690.1 restriction endonuclease [Acetobacterium fimetarium]
MKAQDLKNSILQLAIRGKLVEQRAEEGTAKELLEKIAAEKKQLIQEGKLKKQKTLPAINEEEIPFDIPDSWEWVRLNQIYNFIDYRGKTPTKITSGVVLITASNIKKGFLDFSKADFISEVEYIERQSRGITNKGDILFTTEAPLGNVAINTLEVASAGQRAITFQQYHDNNFINELFCYFIQSPYFQFDLINNATGTTAKGIKAARLKELLLPFPPLEEQKRIVAKIEELMPYVDKYDVAYSEVEKLNKKFPEDMQKSILQYAIQGKLVAQRKEDGTAEELYQQIQEEKKKLIEEGTIKKTKALPEITEDEIPFDIPENWKWVRITDIFEINPRNNVSDELGVSFIPMALIDDGYVSNFTYEVRPWGDVKKGYTHFQDGDIVMAKITPCFQNLKSALIINLENRIGAGTTELHVLRSHSNICREFFMWFIKSPIFVSTCEKNMTGTAGQKRVPTDVLKEYVVPLPPLEEQKRIVEKIEELLPYAKQLVK